MKNYEQNLHIIDSAFDKMRADTDSTLQALLKNMIEKGSFEGKVSISIDVELIPDFIPNYDPAIEGETRRVLIPKIGHKVGSVMQIKNEMKGDTNFEGMEIVFDEESGEYILKPITNTAQTSIFDAEYTEVHQERENGGGDILSLPGRKVAALPDFEEEDKDDDPDDYEDYGPEDDDPEDEDL